MQVGEIEKHLLAECRLDSLVDCNNALDVLIVHMPGKLVKQLCFRELKTSIDRTIVKHKTLASKT